MTDPKQAAKQASDEREALKARAATLGITLQGNQSNDTIRALIREKMGDSEEAQEAKPSTNAQGKRTPSLREFQIARDMKLVRVSIYCADPKKLALPGETITTGNEVIGTVRKYIPFGEKTENGYHVPQCILNVLKERRFLQITRKVINGKDVTQTAWVKEFNITEMEPLDKEDLAELAKLQLATGSLKD